METDAGDTSSASGAGGTSEANGVHQEPGEQAAAQSAQQRLREIMRGSGPGYQTFAERLSNGLESTLGFVRDHWLGIYNGVLGTFVGVALLTPIAYAVGLTGPASAIFNAYRFTCAQTPSHSFFIGGYQVCLCSRCLAIYSTLLLAGIALGLVRNRRVIRGIPWYVWVLAMVPMALDGFTQLFGLRESNLALRLLTGSIFGLSTAWFLLPQIQQAATEVPAPPPQPQPAYYTPPDDIPYWATRPDE